jgi:hypothetical protein
MLNNLRSPVFHRVYRANLKKKISVSQKQVREKIKDTQSTVFSRIQARNIKRPYHTLNEEKEARRSLVSEQIRAWRSMLPTLLIKFSRIKDIRRAKSVKHQLVAVMLFGLLAFVFRLSSRREMNRELTGAVIHHQLRKLFPELDSLPHADTLARVLKTIHPQQIESTHIELIKNLIRRKKFKKLLIHQCLPISIDGVQKLFRNGLLHDSNWLQRTVGREKLKQQYVYALEANITLQNGLTIPLATEYLAMENNQLIAPQTKQDSELAAFERLAAKLKAYFTRLKLILFMDALYATQSVIEILHKNRWEFMIEFSKNKLKYLATFLNKKRKNKMSIPVQPYYRGRRQEFYWHNYLQYGYENNIDIHLIACLERWEEVNTTTSKIEIKYSEHKWISSIPLSIDNLHELCNLGARKKSCIEDGINTEKNRGYHYKHLYSHDWNTMHCFHLLLRLGHAMNALSEFTKKLKKYIKENGCSATLIFLKETLFHPWLSDVWLADQNKRKPQLRFQME